MKILFPNGIPTNVTNKTERDQLRRAEQTLRHAGITPGHEKLTEAAETIRLFVDEQEQQNEADVEELAVMEEQPPAK